MKKYLLISITFLAFQTFVTAQTCNEIFTIYLVRHSEKSNDSSDPPLTKCGEQRSEYLNSFLRDVPLKTVYSTSYERTRSTALPTATAKGLPIIEYDASELKAFSKTLLNNKQDALVVGHSNTTAILAGLLVGKELDAFGLAIYDRIYQVVLYKNTGRLHLLHSSFTCME